VYKFVSLFKYLNKKEKILLILTTVVNTIAFVMLVLGNSFLFRGISALVYLATQIVGMMIILKIQAHITHKEFDRPYRCDCHCDCNDDDEDYEDDDAEEDKDNEE